MFRNLITGAVLLMLIGLAASDGKAQLLSHRKSSGGSTLAARLSRLKNAFLRDDDDEKTERSGYQHAGRDDSSPRAPEPRVARVPLPALNHGRVRQGDFLPKGIFDRNAPAGHRGNEKNSELGDEVFESSARRGSVFSGNANQTTNLKSPRKSPATERDNELQEALSDLLSTDIDESQDRANSATSSEPVSGKSTTTTNATPHDAKSDAEFNMRQVMIDKSKSSPADSTTPSRALATGPSKQAMNELRNQFKALENSEKVDRDVLDFPTRANHKPYDRDNQAAQGLNSTDPVAKPAQDRQVSPQLPPITAEKETLSASRLPVIASRIEGPPQIMVGREATFRVTLENASQDAARNITAEVQIPEWAEVVDAISSSGIVEQSKAEDADSLKWRIQDLGGRSRQELVLKLVPHAGKPLHLSVKWSQAPASAQAMVEVQEPKLEMNFGGPQEVRFNKPQRYELVLRNPGSGPAENVVIRLIPPGGDEQTASTHKVGTVGPGATKRIELELTAREAGSLVMKALATATGGLEAEAQRDVLCRKPELKVDWRGPKEKYAGTEAPYYFRIRNEGTVDAEEVTVSVTLPTGAKLTSASDGYQLDAETGTVSWQLPTVATDEAKFLQIRCQMDRAGTNRFELQARTSGGESLDTKELETNVIAVADLKLTVTDPKGPVPVGETAVYEIRIRNRGTTNAQNVGVVGLFSEGIDPTAVEGAQFTVRDGRVSIHPINSLPAGQELVLKIRAVASQAGTHVFRAEVSCQDLEIKLAAEETTRFYEDKFRWEDGETAYSSERDGAVSR